MTTQVVSRKATSLGAFATDPLDLFAFIAPALLGIQVHVVGTLMASDVFMLLALPALILASRQRSFGKTATLVLLLGIGWLWGQVVSDLIHGSPFTDYSRGWARIIFLLTNFAALYIAIDGKTKRIRIAVAGLAAGLILEYFVSPGQFAQTSPWKFSWAIPVTLTVVLLISHRSLANKLVLPTVFLCGMAFIHLAAGDRSYAGITFLTALYILLQRVVDRGQSNPSSLSGRHIALLGAVGVLGVVGFTSLYGYLAGSGVLGTGAQTTYAQASAGQDGLLFSDRGALLSDFSAIGDSPIIGHGSYAQNIAYYWDLIAKLESLGYTNVEVPGGQLTIPEHSHIFGSWVEAGILGALFWAWVLVLAIRALAVGWRIRDSLSPIVFFLALNTVWDVLFSPYGLEQRVRMAVAAVVFVSVLEGKRRPATER